MSIWAIADLHLSFGVPNKAMDIFGTAWVNHPQKIEAAWRAAVQEEDLVLIPGDISWAMRTEDARPDLEWIGTLPGTKVMIRGNHDLWWGSLSKVKSILPPSCHLIQNTSFTWNDISIAGARMWDTSEFNFGVLFDSKSVQPTEIDQSEDKEKIFLRELGRLEMSLQAMDPNAKKRIVMTHYPPVGLELHDSRVSQLLEKYRIDVCVFGHLHNVDPNVKLFGEKNGIKYQLVACDYLQFQPLLIF